MNILATIENICEDEDVPEPSMMRRWLSAALTHQSHGEGVLPPDIAKAEISIRIVDEAESQTLNARYRDRDAPTNVLSFPADLPTYVDLPLLGDLVICAPLVAREALAQHKTLHAHWAHMLIHGTLHLLGYDHNDDEEAERMEMLETNIMMQLDYPPPYEDLEAGQADYPQVSK